MLARSRPEDKYALVTGLLERGHVVAVTGDGTNDGKFIMIFIFTSSCIKEGRCGFCYGDSRN